jgi:hypothetical protein
MRKLLFFFLRISGALRKGLLKLRGKTEAHIHDQRISSGKAWSDFCDDLKAAGNVLLSAGTPRDPFQQAEGMRYLSRLTRAGLEAYVEYADPAFPQLRRMVHETVKMGADNPDNYYMNAQISGDFEYKIRGIRNSIDYISFHTQNGSYGTTGGLAPCGKLEDGELVLEKDGSFEIYVSREPRGKNWLKMEEESSLLMVRQTFSDRFSEVPAQLEIQNLSGATKPDPLGTEQMDRGLKTASLFVGGASLLFARWANDFKKHINQLPQFDPDKSDAAGGDESIIYYHSYWRLAADESLIIEVQPPPCEAWNFQLNNHWMESLDYRYYNICINKHNAAYLADGRVRLVVSHRDPGMPNWIETAHHLEGTMCWRWYRIHKGHHAVQPGCRVVKLNELNYHE